MKRHDILDDLIRSRLDALVRDLPSVRTGSERALHRTRVASRRVRETLPLLDLKLATLDMGRVRRRTRGLTRALGEVRELDVALGLLDEFSTGDAERRRVLERVRAAIRQRRDRERQVMLLDLEKLEPEQLVRELSTRLETSGAEDTARTWRHRLADLLQERSRRVREAVEVAGVMFMPERLHAARIALKKLRYGMELADETAVAPTKPLLKRLKAEQERLGRLHDLEILGGLVAEVRGEAPPGASGEALRALGEELDIEMRRLHAAFVAERSELLAICARAEAIADDARREPMPAADDSAARRDAS